MFIASYRIGGLVDAGYRNKGCRLSSVDDRP